MSTKMSLLNRKSNKNTGKNNTEVKTKSDIIDALETWAKMETFATAVGVVMEPKLTVLDAKLKKLEADIASVKDAVSNKLPAKTATKPPQQPAPSKDQERTERLRVLRITGLPSNIKQAKDKLLDLAKTDMVVALSPADFTLTCTETRTGSKVHIARFLAVWKRREIYRSRAKLSGSGVYLSEHLDRPQQDLFYKCRTLCREHTLYRTWSYDLEIYVKKTKESAPIKVEKDDDLTQFLLDSVQSDNEDPTPPLSRSSSSFLGFDDNDVTKATKEKEEKKKKLVEELEAQLAELRDDSASTSNDETTKH